MNKTFDLMTLMYKCPCCDRLMAYPVVQAFLGEPCDCDEALADHYEFWGIKKSA